MKEIKLYPLSKGLVTTVDDEDFVKFGHYFWFVSGKSNYAKRKSVTGKKRIILLHREVLGLTNPRQYGDHKDGNVLNNCRNNLRPATRYQNAQNRRRNKKPGHSKYKGVTLNKRDKTWKSTITYNGKVLHLGYFNDEISAAYAYNQAAVEYHKEFAKLNQLPDKLFVSEKNNRSSKFEGVYWHGQSNRWRMFISHKGKITTKNCLTELDAAKSYNEFVTKYSIKGRKLNII